MKTIGLIGGMSWESTTSYYQIINETIKKELGGLHSAKILLYSVDFAEVEHYQAVGDWEKSAQLLADIAQRLEQAGADFIVICTNTMHKVAPQIQEKITIPILHIAQATAQALLADGIQNRPPRNQVHHDSRFLQGKINRVWVRSADSRPSWYYRSQSNHL